MTRPAVQWMVQWRCAVTVGVQNGTVTVCCDSRCTEWYSDGVLWLSVYRMVQWRCAVTVVVQNGRVTVCCDCRCTEWYIDGVLWLSVKNNFALSNLNDLAAELLCLLLNFHCLYICSSTCFCRNLCLPRQPSDSLKNCLFQPDRSVNVYSLYGNETQLW